MNNFSRFHHLLALLLGVSVWGVGAPGQASPCPAAALSQVRTHRTEAGESLETVAAQYGLLPATLSMMNPTLPAQGVLPAGQALAIPPFNGTSVRVSDGQTWQSLAEQHGTKADLLFEVNGCPAQLPSQVFIPGRNSRMTAVVPGALGYPLVSEAPVVLSYGWQPHPRRNELVFNSGIALATMPGSEVLAAADGTVAFVGEHNGALMVILNHTDGLQTRYGNLADFEQDVGDVVDVGRRLGIVAGDSPSSFVYFEVRTNSSEGWVARDPAQYLSDLELRR
ncbi:MAG: M23 family metallopeptidase [Cyanobacteria bacterium P01_D01_bin.156]